MSDFKICDKCKDVIGEEIQSNDICEYCTTDYASIACRGCLPVNGRAGFQGKKVREFIKSTKIPTSCDKCLLAHEMCDFSIRHGGNQCRRVWRKIWEYTK